MLCIMIVPESLLVSTVFHHHLVEGGEHMQRKSSLACQHHDHHNHDQHHDHHDHHDHHAHLVEGGGPMQGKPTLAGHHQALTHLPALTLTAHLNIIIDIVVINMMIIDMMIFIKMFILDSYP